MPSLRNDEYILPQECGLGCPYKDGLYRRSLTAVRAQVISESVFAHIATIIRTRHTPTGSHQSLFKHQSEVSLRKVDSRHHRTLHLQYTSSPLSRCLLASSNVSLGALGQSLFTATATVVVRHQHHIALYHQPLFSPGARKCLAYIDKREYVHRPCGCAFDE